MKKLTFMVVACATTFITACTPREHALWLEWHAADPTAAEAFAEEWKAAQSDAPQFDAEADTGTRAWTVNWDRIAQCESGGDWSHPPVTNRYGTFSGGLMWNHRYWDANGGERYADQPWQASKAEQIAVSEDMVDGSLAAVDRAWQCYP
jgi:hypothetical protein